MHGAAVSGEPVAVDTDAVAAGPALPAAAQRHAHTTTPLAPPGVRVVTYNVLADQYASTDYAQEHLFAYCPRECAILHSQHLITALLRYLSTLIFILKSIMFFYCHWWLILKSHLCTRPPFKAILTMSFSSHDYGAKGGRCQVMLH